MPLTSPAEILLSALVTAAERRAKIKNDTLLAIFLRAFPQWQGDVNRRGRLRELIDELAGAQRIRLPTDLRRGWEKMPAPSLPKWVMLVREDTVAEVPFDHRTFPWVEPLHFVASLRSVTNAKELQRIQEFLKHDPERRPIVPVKERSFQLFGDEKRLDSLRKTKPFALGQLTLELLRCRDVSASLPCVPASQEANGPWLIVENEAAFDTFARLNALRFLHGGIILGSGRNVLRAIDFLAALGDASKWKDFLYFGDIDRDGIEIPVLLNQRLYQRAQYRILPAEQYYDWLLTAAGFEVAEVGAVETNSLTEWFPSSMRARMHAALMQNRPVVQEAIGWEFLSARFDVVDVPEGMRREPEQSDRAG